MAIGKIKMVRNPKGVEEAKSREGRTVTPPKRYQPMVKFGKAKTGKRSLPKPGTIGKAKPEKKPLPKPGITLPPIRREGPGGGPKPRKPIISRNERQLPTRVKPQGQRRKASDMGKTAQNVRPRMRGGR